MKLDTRLLDTIAATFTYPEADSGRRLAAAAADLLAHEAGDVATAVDALATWLSQTTLGNAEERYTRLFDLSPVCTLNIGYHLFGETYERGGLLAGLTRELAIVGLDAGDEIPDSLPVLLRLLGRMSDPTDRELLLAEVVLPGLKEIDERLKDATDPWSRVLRTLSPFLTAAAKEEGLDVTRPERPAVERLPIVQENPAEDAWSPCGMANPPPTEGHRA